MTVEWKDICPRCEAVHEASPDGHGLAPCVDRTALVELLHRRRRLLAMRRFLDGEVSRVLGRSVRELLLTGRVDLASIIRRDTEAEEAHRRRG